MFAASVGWYVSQNTYLLLSSHILDDGPHGIMPPNRPPPEQQAEFALSNPKTKFLSIILCMTTWSYVTVDYKTHHKMNSSE